MRLALGERWRDGNLSQSSLAAQALSHPRGVQVEIRVTMTACRQTYRVKSRD